MCEQHKHGSVGAGAGNRPGYPTECLSGDSRGALRADTPSADHAASGSVLVRSVAANAAGERIPSELCGLRWL